MSQKQSGTIVRRMENLQSNDLSTNFRFSLLTFDFHFAAANMQSFTIKKSRKATNLLFEIIGGIQSTVLKSINI